MDINKIRASIDDIDHILAQNFQKRLELMKDVADYKVQHQLPLLNTKREQEVIEKNTQNFPQHLRYYGKYFFSSVMTLCKDYQISYFPITPKNSSSALIGFQGMPGSFSHQALDAYFGLDVKTKHYPLFEDAAKALENGEIAYAVLPIENSSIGAINEVYDLLRKYHLTIVGEKIIPIRHQLLGVNGSTCEQIEKVYSHVQGLRQSSDFLNTHSHMIGIETINTAEAAHRVAQTKDPSLAAIASKRAADIYGLTILAADIHNNSENSTRFIIVSAEHKENTGNKVSTSFTLPHQAGSLVKVLKILEIYNLSMTKLESRPKSGCPWEYVFYLDFEFDPHTLTLEKILKELKDTCSDFVFLGLYSIDRDRS